MKQWVIVGLTIIGGSVAGVGCGGGDMAAPSADGNVAKNTSAISAQTLATNTQFFVPPPQPGAVQQVANLLKSKDLLDAARVADMALTPQAVWFQSGSPKDVQKSVKQTMAQAALEKRVPVLVSYNIPYRDCAQYSAGGALDTPSYEAWIDGFAAGIGKGQAVVILEPDSLGLIPYNYQLYQADPANPVMESCQPTLPTGTTGAQLNQARYAQLNYAVNSIRTQAPNALVYLDGTHSAWLASNEVAYRLSTAGVAQSQGFFLNISNYQPMPQLEKYGRWIAECIWFATDPGSWGHQNSGCANPMFPNKVGCFDWCASQYYPATSSDFSTWSQSDAWYANNVENQNWVPYPGDAGLLHYVIDTSRNGQGPFDATTEYSAAPYNQPATVITALNAGNWCNPPGAGLGLRPSANTGVSLLDAYLWVKTPGESDGSCDKAGNARDWNYSDYNPWNLSSAAAESLFDPLWGIDDPAAGVWFPQQALQLAQLANPKLL